MPQSAHSVPRLFSGRTFFTGIVIFYTNQLFLGNSFLSQHHNDLLLSFSLILSLFNHSNNLVVRHLSKCNRYKLHEQYE